MAAKVTKDMLVSDVIKMDEKLIPIFFAHGLFCLGCVLADHESLEEASEAHGLDVDSLVDDLNSYLEKGEY
ncbi:MAG: DUF1858 domain-containing protein [Clostridiaceae bacterium]|nr:DUF1858 domain-containing protein [Clostridiaceae bacterium]HZW98368.1 DUF1858 domain-containing protein [Bacillota bacterium]